MYSPASLENAVQPSRLKCFSLQFFFCHCGVGAKHITLGFNAQTVEWINVSIECRVQWNAYGPASTATFVEIMWFS